MLAVCWTAIRFPEVLMELLELKALLTLSLSFKTEHATSLACAPLKYIGDEGFASVPFMDCAPSFSNLTVCLCPISAVY